jgi:hypothetical protein
LCAETDVRPRILGDHRVKFKCQAMALKEKLGGIRLLFSHNVQFFRSANRLHWSVPRALILVGIVAVLFHYPREVEKAIQN